jgi:hypothetical protein
MKPSRHGGVPDFTLFCTLANANIAHTNSIGTRRMGEKIAR